MGTTSCESSWNSGRAQQKCRASQLQTPSVEEVRMDNPNRDRDDKIGGGQQQGERSKDWNQNQPGNPSQSGDRDKTPGAGQNPSQGGKSDREQGGGGQGSQGGANR